jgi:hypothetical protein
MPNPIANGIATAADTKPPSTSSRTLESHGCRIGRPRNEKRRLVLQRLGFGPIWKTPSLKRLQARLVSCCLRAVCKPAFSGSAGSYWTGGITALSLS